MVKSAAPDGEANTSGDGAAPAVGDGGFGPARRGWGAAVAVGLAILGVYLLTIPRATLWDRDEAYYARTAAEMIETGNYLYPTYNGKVFAEKPPLNYWLMSQAMRLFGPSEFACRFFAVVGVLATCLLTYLIARRLLNGAAGIWAMVALASAPLMILIGMSAVADAVMLPLIVAALAAFAQSLAVGVRPRHVAVMALACGGAMLAKGPMGLVPICVIAGALWLGRRRIDLGWRYLGYAFLATLIGAAIFAGWFVPADRATGGQFTQEFFGRHVFGRALDPMQGHGGQGLTYFLLLPLYVPVMIAGFFPWTLYLPGALSALAGGRIGGQKGRALLLAWMIVVFAAASLGATKLPHYVLSIWPAMALAVGGVIVAAGRDALTDRDRKWLRRGTWLFAPVAFGLPLAAGVGVWFLPVPALRTPLLALGAVSGVTGVLALRYHRAERYRAGAAVVLAGMLILHGVFVLWVLPAVEQVKLAPSVARAITARTRPDVPVTALGFHEPTLHFYVARHVEYIFADDAVRSWATRPGPGVLVLPRTVLDRVEKRSGPLNAEQIAAQTGLNYSRGQWLELVAIGRNLPPAAPADTP